MYWMRSNMFNNNNPKVTNVYDVINNELERLHYMYENYTDPRISKDVWEQIKQLHSFLTVVYLPLKEDEE